MIDLIIISFNNKELTKQAIESALNNTVKPHKIILVDNNSTDGCVEYIKHHFDSIDIIELPQNFGYGKAANIGVSYSDSPYVVVSNNDVIFPNNFFQSLEKLVENLNFRFGVAGFQQIYPDGSFQNSYGSFHNVFGAILDVLLVSLLEVRIKKLRWKLGQRKVKKVDYVDGAVLLLNKEAFQKIGGFDEDFFFYSEEVDLCKRMKEMGFPVIFAQNIEVIHYRGQGKNKIGIGKNSIPQFVTSRVLFCKKHLNKCSTIIYLLLQGIFYQEISLLLRLKQFFMRNNYKEQIFLTSLISKEFLKSLKSLNTFFLHNKHKQD